MARFGSWHRLLFQILKSKVSIFIFAAGRGLDSGIENVVAAVIEMRLLLLLRVDVVENYFLRQHTQFSLAECQAA
jgi:hypothetical protein